MKLLSLGGHLMLGWMQCLRLLGLEVEYCVLNLEYPLQAHIITAGPSSCHTMFKAVERWDLTARIRSLEVGLWQLSVLLVLACILWFVPVAMWIDQVCKLPSAQNKSLQYREQTTPASSYQHRMSCSTAVSSALAWTGTLTLQDKIYLPPINCPASYSNWVIWKHNAIRVTVWRPRQNQVPSSLLYQTQRHIKWTLSSCFILFLAKLIISYIF